jgi:hypothetical protein
MADEFVRVKDTETGSEFTAHVDSGYANDSGPSARFKVLKDKDAVDANGKPLDAKHDPLSASSKAKEASK